VKVRCLAAAALIACAGVLAKESAVVVLPFAVLHDFFWRWPEWRRRGFVGGWRPGWSEFGLKGFAVFLPAVALLVFTRVQLALELTPPGRSFVDNPIAFASPVQSAMTALGVVGRYLALLFYPQTLSCDYSYDQIPLFGQGRSWWQDVLPWVSIALVTGFLWCSWRWRQRHRVAAWGIAFFFVALLPTSNLLLPIGAIMAERFLYLPSVGFCAAIAVALATVGATGITWRGAVSLLALGALGIRTYMRNADWRDESALWRSAVAAAPNSFKTHLAYAGSVWESSDQSESALDVAIARTEVGREILEREPLPPEHREPNLYLQLGTLHRFKGDFLVNRARPAEAGTHFAQAIEFLTRAREVDRRNVENLRLARAARGRSAAAPVAVAGNIKIAVELALCHLRLSEWEALKRSAVEVQALVPSDPTGYAYRGVAEFNSGRPDLAATFFVAALLLNTADGEIRQHLVSCFERLNLQPAPFAVNGAAITFDFAHPRMRQHVEEAFVLLVRNHDAALRWRESAELKAVARREFQVPETAFSADLREPKRR